MKLPTYTDLRPVESADIPQATDSRASYANAGAGEEAAAQTGEIAQKAAGDIQDLYSKTLVNDAFVNKFAPVVQQKMSDFYNLQGKAAVDGLPVLQQSLSGLQSNVTDGMTGQQKLIMDEMTRNQVESEMVRASMHAGEQGRAYMANTQSAMLTNHLTNIENDPSTYNTELMNGKVAIQSYGQQPSVSQSPDEIQRDINTFSQKAAEAKYTAMAATDPTAAYNDFTANKSSLPGNVQTKLSAWLLPQVKDSAVGSYVSTLPQQVQEIAASGQSAKPFAFTMQHEGGYVSNDSGKGPTNFGINQEANPGVDVSKLTQDDARNIIQTKYADPIGADKMSPALAMVAVDSAVNMGVSKTQALLAQAGGDPNKLIDLRTQEYQRLAAADPAKYGPSLAGWTQRMSDLKTAVADQANAPNSAYQSPTDTMVANRDTLLANAEAEARSKFPNDAAMVTAYRTQVNQTITAAQESQAARYKQDNNSIMQAISGAMTNGNAPQTRQELMAIPGVADVVKRVAVQDVGFYGDIDKKIAEFSSKNTTTNSPNGFDTIMRATQDESTNNPNGIYTQDHLNKLVGNNGPENINLKDYNDAKPLIGADQGWKDFVNQGMKKAATANGNVDGQGQQRALAWYSQVNKAYLANQQLGDKALSIDDLKEKLQTANTPPQPSRMDQISNWAKSLFNGGQNVPAIPTLTDKAQFDALPSGSSYIRNGQQYRKP